MYCTFLKRYLLLVVANGFTTLSVYLYCNIFFDIKYCLICKCLKGLLKCLGGLALKAPPLFVPTLNDYLIDYRVCSVYVLHVTRVVVAVGPLERRDRHVSVFRYLCVTVPRLYGSEALQPLLLDSRLSDRGARQFQVRPPGPFD